VSATARRDAPGWVALAALFGALAAWSWRRWADVQVDFGRELYAAWRIASGERLFADVAWFNGPLSAWWNAGWLALCGASWSTLIAVNLSLVALGTVGIWSLVRGAAGRAAAWAGSAVFLCVFAFGQYAGIANYNFVAPYSHELVHGFLASVLALVLAARLERRGERWTALALGLALGLAFLTKAEAFLGGALAGGARLALAFRARAVPRPAARAALILVGFQVPVVAAFARLARDLPAGQAARGVLGSWPYAGNERLRALPFYRSLAGLDDPGEQLARTAAWGLGALVLVGLFTLVAARLPRARGATRPARAFAFLAGAAAAAACLGAAGLAGVGRVLPWAALALGVLAAARWRRAGEAGEREERASAADAVGLAVLALAFGAKSGLAPRIPHYGFVLALPGALALCALVVGELPRRLRARGRAGAFLSSAMCGALAVVCAGHLGWSQRYYHGERGKRVLVGRGGDRLWAAEGRGGPIAEALAEIERALPPEGTLLVLPEGVMLNWLARRRTPTRFLNFMPPELVLWDELEVVAALERAPPDLVAFVHKDTSEYGVPYFGRGLYGKRIVEWVERRYHLERTFGAPPLEDGRFGVALWSR